MNVPGKLVPDHFHVHLISHAEPEAADEVLIDPRFQLTHPALRVRLTVIRKEKCVRSLPESGLLITTRLWTRRALCARLWTTWEWALLLRRIDLLSHGVLLLATVGIEIPLLFSSLLLRRSALREV